MCKRDALWCPAECCLHEVGEFRALSSLSREGLSDELQRSQVGGGVTDQFQLADGQLSVTSHSELEVS